MEEHGRQPEAHSAKEAPTFETSDINALLMKFSKDHKIGVDEIDFDLKKVTTELVDTQSGEREILASDKIDISADRWASEHLSVSQKFTVALKRKHANENANLILSVGADKYVTKVAAVIKKESKLRFYDGLEEYIVNELNKKKARHKLLVGFFDADMRPDVQKLCDHLKLGGGLDSDYRIRIVNCPDYKPARDDELVFCYQIKNKESARGGNTNIFSAKSDIVSVAQNELIVEYKKALPGVAGRNARGEYLAIGQPIVKNTPQFKVTDAVGVVETNESIEYKAKSDGFVLFEKGVLDIKKELSVREITAKTGSIDIGDRADAVVSVQSESKDSDAIGDNVTVRAGEVRVSGSIGAGASVEAAIVDIGGQTHRTSHIEAKTAKIHNHKGYLQSQEADIEVLEGGTVIAVVARIGTMMGGEVHAQEIHIDTLGSNATIIASSLIEIQHPKGDGNRIFIEAAASPKERAELEQLQSEISILSHELSGVDEELKEKLDAIEKNRDFASTIKERIAEERKKNSPMANVLLSKFKHFAQTVNEEKQLEVHDHELREQLAIKKGELEEMQKRTLNARIVANSMWRGSNLVKFKLLSPLLELSLPIEERSKIGQIFLRHDDGGYSIETKASTGGLD